MVTLRIAIMASAIMEPPVWPVLTPMLARKLSIFCDTFKKLTAQRNQISTFPVTDSRLDALIWASTSLSVIARAGAVRTTDKARTAEKKTMNLRAFFVVAPPHMDNGLAIKTPTMLINSFRHHAFIRSRNT